ncbi:MAG: DUF3306 domain-containing protein [Paracoccaceae bacterium]|nr:DUF3306 domain-containing protein [Paracoccaceae bacterium]MDH5528943.1 DUF3306 domain-containing protein [Paracoccaceae bacterium]
MDGTQAPTNFWSRRRAAVEAEAAAEIAARESEIAAEAQQAIEAAQAEKTDAQILEELGLKDPDDMIAGDDFAAFMRASVPERLRRRALRVLWRSNPVLANLDGLLDHDDDFSDAATIMPDMKSAYQVGKGMLHHVQEMARQAENLTDMAEAATDDIINADVAEEIEAEPVMMLADEATDRNPEDAPKEDIAEPEQVQPLRRHMRFAFAENTGGEIR